MFALLFAPFVYVALAASVSRHWQVIARIQRTVGTLEAQITATVAAAGGFLLALAGVYVGGRALRERYGADLVQAGQGLAVTVLSLLFGAFLAIVWRLSREVLAALAVVQFGPTTGVKVLVTFIVFAVAYTITRFTKRSIKTGTGRDAITAHQREIAHHVVQIAVFTPAILFTVALWGVPARDLFLGAGALGIILGFAARRTLSGALSGFVILFARPFEVGDWIAVNDREGIVTDVTLYNTQIRTFDEEHVLVPNDAAMNDEVINYSKTDRLRLGIDVGVDYETDLDRAVEVATEAMRDLDPLLAAPEPDVILKEFGDSAVVLRLRFWIDRPTVERKWQAHNAVVRAVKAAFEREGIEIPYPQRQLSGRGREDRRGRSPDGNGAADESAPSPAPDGDGAGG